ncbi:MAG: DHH family phosphoesterase [Lachnospiraceae bacterium]|nr:DHH family phosphoesterase [Lachnospiraceae bacterium]
MDSIQYKGKLKWYFYAPLYITSVFFVASLILAIYNFKLGMVMGAVVAFYTVIVFVLFKFSQSQIEQELINFATRYSTVQKELLEHFQVPYALIDDTGKILWVNEAFAYLTTKDKRYRKSVTSIFREITRESLEAAKHDEIEYDIEYNEHNYTALLRRLHIEESASDADMIQMETTDKAPLISVMLLDKTELVNYKRWNDEQKMVAGLVYIDNYDETFESVEEVKRALLNAVIDRKISKYFEKADGIVRKLEKDKYAVFFQNRYLHTMEQDRFSLLEDIKSTKVGNENEVTISIGLGVGADTYRDLAAYSRAAIGLALGRGGSQAVIKDVEDVSYYGLRGREIEKNTRVKARVKAQALRELMKTSGHILVMGHQISDPDALGAAIGVYVAAREMGKKCQIILNTVTASLRTFVDDFTNKDMYPEDMFLESYQALDVWDKDTLVIVVDTNRPSNSECPELLERGGPIVVIDHHRTTTEQIANPTLSYIEPYASSACEMITEILQYFSDRIRLEQVEADCLYAGILIDTNNFLTKTGVRTFEAAAYLKRCGADVTRVRKMLREDMDAYKARAEIVRRAEVYRGAFAISICHGRELESPTVVGAQASNELLNIIGIKASFVLTKFHNKIYVSARSIDEIDVQRVMERMGGGGHLNVAGAQIADVTEEEVMRRIEQTIDAMIEEGEIVL